mmetsp:Transcript_20625/g.59902  ORF Transcript_20625/g.59902 Transcript_20625/m.59902 type:complete len:82 (+) Transcript_20625:1038-1283(+)
MILPTISGDPASVRRCEKEENEGLQLVLQRGFELLGPPSKIMVREVGSDASGLIVPWIGRHRDAALDGFARPFASTGFEFG